VTTLRSLLAVCALAMMNVACVASFASGLRTRNHDVSAFRGVPIDVEASELTILGNGEHPPVVQPDLGAFGDVTGGTSFMEVGPTKERRDTIFALTSLFGEASAGAEKARVKIAYGYDASSVPVFFPCLTVLVVFGCPMQKVEVATDLTIELRGKRYTGHGTATRWMSMYNVEALEPAKGEALGAALDDAIRRGGVAP